MKNADTYLLDIEHLFRYYGKFCAVKDLNLKVKPGTFGLLGPNGAGKTTTISILVGILRPDYGKITIFNNLDYYKNGLEIRQKIGFLPERNFVMMNLPARKFLIYLGQLYGISKEKLKKDVDWLLKFVGLGDWANQPAKKFSGGMRQRLGLASALINRDADLYIFDEPTSNMDPIGRAEILEKINELTKDEGKSIIYCSHILSEVEKVCENVAIMNEGEIIATGKISELSEKLAKNLFKVRISNSELFFEKLAALTPINIQSDMGDYIIFECDSPTIIHDNIPKILYENQLKLYHLETVQLNLEEIFNKLVRGNKNEN